MRISLAIIAITLTACSSTAQTGSKQPSSSSDSAIISKGINTIGGIFGGKNKSSSSSSTLSNSEIIAGLKQALEKGAQISGDKLSAVDGYFANAALKILMPEEAKKVETTLRSMGMGKLVDDAILSMNRAAEDAAKSAAPIFINAIKTMSIYDALGILKGSDTAATSYLRGRTTSSLTEAFRPAVENSLQKVGATKYWNTVFTNYNRFAMNKINPDLTAFVTERALSGIFIQLGQEEKRDQEKPGCEND